MSAPQRVDAHMHLWDLSVSEYAWLGPQNGELFTSFNAEQACRELKEADFDSAVLVQAEDSLRDTEFLLDTAAAHAWVAGVVGWVPLDDTAATERALDRWQQHPAFRGVRHLVHNDPRDDFFALPAVRSSLSMVAERGLTLDVPDAWPRHLASVATLADDTPGLRIVIDHLAKPPTGSSEFRRWREVLADVAARENTAAKVSGLRSAETPYTAAALHPAWDAALDLFGPSRLMYGGDWPMSVPEGGYQPTWHVLGELIDELGTAEQVDLLGRTATEIYQLR